MTVLHPEPAKERPGLVASLPISRWRDAHDFLQINTKPAPFQYLSPDGTTFIPTTQDPHESGSGRQFFSPAISPAPTGWYRPQQIGRFFVADEFGQKIWSFSVNPNGSLADPKLFAEEGEAGVAVDAHGNVYVAAGNIFVYDPTGKQIDLIEVPERPTSLVFGGKDRQTLFIAARSSLYAIRTKSKRQ